MDLHFRDQTILAGHRAVSQWRSRTKNSKSSGCTSVALIEPTPARSEDGPSVQVQSWKDCFQTTSFNVAARAKACPLLYAPNVPQEAFVINLFFLSFVSCPRNPIPWLSYLKALPSLYAAASPTSCLPATVLAVSYAHLAGRTNSPAIRSRAIAQYGRALRLLSETLSKGKGDFGNEVVSSSNLLALYESMMSDEDLRSESIVRHLRGAVVLARIRGQDIMATELGRTIFMQLYFHNVSVVRIRWTVKANMIPSSSSVA